MTSPTTTVTLTEAELMRLANEIRKLLRKAEKYAGSLVAQWQQAIDTWVQRTQAILGDRPDLQKAIAAWKRVATEISSIEYEFGRVTNRDSYWNGAGADAFEGWVGQHVKDLEQWKRTFGSTGTASGVFIKGLDAASTAVVNFLVGIDQAFNTLLSGLVDAVGHIGGIISISFGPKDTGITVNPSAITMAVASVVNKFIDAANIVVQKAADVLTTADAAGNDLEAAANSLTRFKPSEGSWDKQGGSPVKSER